MKAILTAVALATAATPVLSHATLEQQVAQVNGHYKAVMRIGHGCEGQDTLSVTIEIPEGVINAKPMPKAGWDLTTVVTPYAKTYELHGPRSEGVTSITWTGELLDSHYDEFIFQAYITESFKDGETIYFPTTQLCADGSQKWVNIPSEGEGHIAYPAPGLKLKQAGGHAHH